MTSKSQHFRNQTLVMNTQSHHWLAVEQVLGSQVTPPMMVCHQSPSNLTGRRQGCHTSGANLYAICAKAREVYKACFPPCPLLPGPLPRVTTFLHFLCVMPTNLIYSTVPPSCRRGGIECFFSILTIERAIDLILRLNTDMHLVTQQYL